MHEQSKQVLHAGTNWAHKIPLVRRDGLLVAYALVDEGDYAQVVVRKWCLHSGGYAYSSRVLMHRLFLGLEAGNQLQGDHRNGDKLDNRRDNLRVCTSAQQQQNMKHRVDGTSRYRGVSWDANRRLWKARVKINHKEHSLGRYADEDEAGRVAADYRRLHFPFSVDR